MKSISGTFYGSALVCFVLIVASLYLWPGAGLPTVAIGTLVVGAIVAFCYQRSGFRTSAGNWILLLTLTAAIIGTIINTYYYTTLSGTTADCPVLFNFDAYHEWEAGKAIALGTEAPDGIDVRNGMALIIAGLIWLFGCNVEIVLLFNTLCYLLAIIATGAITFELTKNKNTVVYAMLFTALMAYLFAQGTTIIKDAPVTASMAGIALLMLRWCKRPYVQLGEAVSMIVLILFITILRPNIMPMLVLGALIFGFRSLRKFDWRFAIVILCAAAIYGLSHAVLPKVAEAQDIVEGSKYINLVDNGTMAWDNMLGNYIEMPFYQKILWLPLSIVVQFLIPFPWAFERDLIHGPTRMIAHFGYFWYYAGALILYWVFVCRKKSSTDMCRTVFWGVLLTVITAYITSGRVSRYCLPYLPLLMPAAATVAAECSQRKSLRVWLIVFTALLVPTLITCYILQSQWL